MPGVVATVNGEQIPYKELADECLLRHGKEVLEVEISHLLLQQALAKQNVTVTSEDLNDEIAHAAQLAGVVDKEGKPDFDKWFQTATQGAGHHQGSIHARLGLAVGRAQEADRRHRSRSATTT